MSKPSTREPLVASSATLADTAPLQADVDAAVIARLGLSTESLHAIYDLMQDRNLSFPEATVWLGFATQGDVAEAIADAAPKKPASDEAAGLIENAIRKISANRQVILRQGDTVQIGPSLAHALNADNPRSEKIRAL